MNEDQVAPPAVWGTFMSPYWFLKEDGFLQHHGLGLTEAVSGALRGLDAKLHCSLCRSAALWWQEERRWLLGGALHAAGSVVHKHINQTFSSKLSLETFKKSSVRSGVLSDARNRSGDQSVTV